MWFPLLINISAILPGSADAQQLPRYSVHEALRIGGAEAPDYATFSSVPALVLDRAGRVFARVDAESRIIAFDSAGRFVRVIGRRGQGPGEFVVSFGHGMIGDTLWVTSGPAPQVARFRPDGFHLRTERTNHPVLQSRQLSGPQGITALLQSGRALYIPDDGLVEPPGRLSFPVLLGDQEMRTVDTVTSVMRPRGLLLAGVGTLWYYPFPEPPLIAVSADGSGLVVVEWQGESDPAVRVRRHDSNGRTSWQRELLLPSPLIPRRVRDSVTSIAVTRARPYVESARQRLGATARLSTVESLVSQGLVLPSHYPPVRDVVAGGDGTTWIQTAAPGGESIWLVLNTSGNPEFEVRIPERVRVHQATRQRIWGTTTDADGVHYIVRLDVQR